MIQNTTINEKIQALFAANMRALSLHIKMVCKRAKLPERIAEALIQDVEDMQQDRITALRLELDDIADIGQATKHEEWKQFRSPILDYIFSVYGQLGVLVNHVATKQPDWDIDEKEFRWEIPAANGKKIEVRSEAVYEYFRRAGTKNEEELQALKDKAAIYRHTWVLCLLLEKSATDSEANITAEDIEPITPQGCTPHIALVMRNLNIDSIFAQYRTGRLKLSEEKKKAYVKQGILTEAAIAEIEGKTAAESKKEQPCKPSEQIINTLQNTADLLSRSINTADMDENGQPMIPRPLLLALEEKKNAAGTDIASMTYVMQAIRGAVVIANTWKPTADGKEKATYSGTLLDITKAITGQKNPVKSQIEATWKALRFLSTQQFEFTEYVTKASRPKRRGRPRKAETAAATTTEVQAPATTIPTELEITTDGVKVRYEAVKVLTNPLTATFRQPLQQGTPYSGSTEVTLDIHHIITEGRRTDKVTLPDGSIAYVKKPVGHLNELQQAYEWNTPAEIRFYGIVLSKSHMKESDMLKDINDYESRMLICTTDEEKEKEKQYRYNHSSRYRDALADMFIKAKDTGLIAWYCRTEAATQTKGKKVEYVWKWGRPTGTTTK